MKELERKKETMERTPSMGEIPRMNPTNVDVVSKDFSVSAISPKKEVTQDDNNSDVDVTNLICDPESDMDEDYQAIEMIAQTKVNNDKKVNQKKQDGPSRTKEIREIAEEIKREKVAKKKVKKGSVEPVPGVHLRPPIQNKV